MFPNICEVKVTKGATSTEVRTAGGEPQADDYYGLTTKYNVSNDKKKFTVAGYFTKNLVNAIDGTGDLTLDVTGDIAVALTNGRLTRISDVDWTPEMFFASTVVASNGARANIGTLIGGKNFPKR